MRPLAAHTPCCQHDRVYGPADNRTFYSKIRCLLEKGHQGRHRNDDEHWD